MELESPFSYKELVKRYHLLARQHHPDKSKQTNSNNFQKISKLYKQLHDYYFKLVYTSDSDTKVDVFSTNNIVNYYCGVNSWQSYFAIKIINNQRIICVGINASVLAFKISCFYGLYKFPFNGITGTVCKFGIGLGLFKLLF